METYTLYDEARTANGRAQIRRYSLEVGSFEENFWRRPEPGEPDRFLQAALLFGDQRRRDRQRLRAQCRVMSLGQSTLAALTGSALRLFQELCAMTRNFRGKVFPSYDHLARATGLGRATVARGIARLKQLGFLTVQRRFARVAGNGPGPRFTQASNSYRIEMPPQAKTLLPRSLRPAPVPCDDMHRRACEKLAADRMRKPWIVKGGFQVGDASLADALNRLARKIAARESQNEAQLIPESFSSSAAPNTPGRRIPAAMAGTRLGTQGLGI